MPYWFSILSRQSNATLESLTTWISGKSWSTRISWWASFSWDSRLSFGPLEPVFSFRTLECTKIVLWFNLKASQSSYT